MAYTAAVITVSDRSFWGQQEDESGPFVAKMLEEAGYAVELQTIVQDEQWQIEQELKKAADQLDLSLVVTVGGTGFAPRNVTPEATQAVCERMAPGIAEAMRAAGMAATPRAMLSRAAAGIRGKTLIVNVPGSVKAARENLGAVLPTLEHGLNMLRGGSAHDAGPSEQ